MKQDISPNTITRESFTEWLRDWVAREFGVDRASIDTGKSFLSYGLDSVQAMTMVGDIEAMLGLELAPTLAWDYADIDALSTYLAERMVTGLPSTSQPGASLASSLADDRSHFAAFNPPNPRQR
jgi:acyl carrier protein